jgi:hypothetical protein
MKKARSLSAVLFAAAVAVAGCEFQRKTTITSADATGANPLAPGVGTRSLLGTWSSAGASSPAATPSSCTDFVWTITSQTDTDVAGNFTAVCLGSAMITGVGSGHISGSTVLVSINGNGSMPGLSTCPFALSGTGTIEGDLIRIPYSGSTCLGPISGTQTLQRSLIQTSPTPAPTPEPSPTPPPPPPPLPSGDVMSQATILNSPLDLPSWPIASRITRLDLRSSGVHVEFSKASGPDRWPDVYPNGWDEPLQYTLGMCMNISNRWYCSAPVQYWYGLYESGGPPSQYAQNWFYDPSRWSPMSGHQPAVGETIGFFACAGNCRNNITGSNSTVKERTDVVLVPMPNDRGASFTF